MGTGRTMVVRCPACETHEVGDVEGAFQYAHEPNGEESTRFSLVRCPKCSGAFLARQEGYEDLDDYNRSYTSWGAAEFLYPGDPTRLDPSVPAAIGASLLEAQRSYDQAAAYTGAAILCRRTLEGICAHFGATKGNLVTKLETLRAEGKLDERFHEWADHVLRGLGNDAAHDVDVTISRDDARDALEFTKALIQQLFVLEAAFKRFKERRSAPGTTA